ncbi:MAG: TonB-dependent receptor [Sphingomonas sp.]
MHIQYGAVLVLTVATGSTAAYGQTTAGSSQQTSDTAPSEATTKGELPDIIVTAERRVQNLQDVPIAATAFGADQLRDKGVSRISDLQFASPSLSVTDAGLTQSANIRGIGIASGSPAVANGVAVYINGVFQPPILTMSSFYDLSNVEVLRGPQGTLVGSNSTGGAIFMTTQAPKLDAVGGYLTAGYGNYNAATVQGALNVPLTNTLAVRVAGNFQRHDSFYTDIGPFNNHPDRLNEKAGRVTVLWQPGALKATAHVELLDRNTGGYAYRPILGTAFGPVRSDDIRTLEYNAPTSNHERAILSDLELRYKLANDITIRYLSGYAYKRINNLYDSDAAFTSPPPTMLAPIPPSSLQTENQFVSEREISQEVNIISPTTGRFNWILGGYYQHNNIHVNIFNTANVPTDPTHILIQDAKTTLGVFAQGGYKITPKLEFELGVRYSHYRVQQTGSVAIGYGTLFGPNGLTVADLAGKHSDGKLTGKANVSFHVDDNNLLYAFVARGYKPGGTNSATSEFRPETVMDYEAGWKSTMLDRHLRTQFGGFYMSYRDFQFDFLDGSSGQTGVVNVANASIYGVEGQFQAKFGGFDLDGGFAYVHSKLGSLPAINPRNLPQIGTLGPQCGTGAPSNPPTCFDYGPSIRTAGGGPNLFSPKWSYNIGAAYRFELSNETTLTPRVNFAYVGSQYTNFFYSPVTDQLKSRGLVSGLITLERGKWTLTVYGDNLTNKKYVSGQSGNNEFYGAPSQYGFRLGVTF